MAVKLSNEVLDGFIGRKYERLTVIGWERDNGFLYLNCRCKCGNLTRIRKMHVVSGATVSCGCFIKEKTIERCTIHGYAKRSNKRPEYRSWLAMKERCRNKNDQRYKNYGGRGISVCQEWLGEGGFESFFEHVGPRPGPNYSLDRIDNNKGYEPGNVRWATLLEQSSNTSRSRKITFNGKTQSISGWAREIGISNGCLSRRIEKWGLERALTTPAGPSKSRGRSMIRVCVELGKSCKEKPSIRMIPVLGVIREVSDNVLPTPQYKASLPVIGELLMAFTMTDSQQTTMSVTFVDKKNNPAPVDGTPTWLVDNPNVLALTPAADGLSCLVSAVGPIGTATVSVKADADLGAGVVEIAGVLDVEVIAGAASVVTIAPGTPSEQP